jgi:hypothetical protein
MLFLKKVLLQHAISWGMNLGSKISKRFREFIRRALTIEPVNQKINIGILTSHAMSARKHSMKNLWDAEFRVFSQFGEDGIIDLLLDELQISKPRIMEIGAGDFSECNSRFALHKRNCSAFLVDMREDLKRGFQESEIRWKASVAIEIAKIDEKNIKDIESRALTFLNHIDLISLDIDGIDFWIAQLMNWDQIKIAVVEYNPVFGAKKSVSVPKDTFNSRFEYHYSGLVYGASLLAWVEFFARKDMRFVGTNRVGNNAFFVPSSLAGMLPFQLPEISQLDAYVDWQIRDSRNQDRTLSFLPLEQAKNLITGVELIDTQTLKRVKFEA